MNVREGMKVMVIHHMSNKGIVTKVYYTPVKHGSLSKCALNLLVN